MKVSAELNALKKQVDTFSQYHWVRYKVIADHSDFGEECRYAKKSFELGAHQRPQLHQLLQDIATKANQLAKELEQ